MRIVQIIDSLECGGAERMAVNYANSLADVIAFSGLIASRKEGNLKTHLNSKVDYLFLKKKSKIDSKAIVALKSYCKKNRVDFIHAHGTSFFTAFLVKLAYPSIKIVWHDHYGLSEFLSARKSFILEMASFFFAGIVSVNSQLKNWAEEKLHCKNVIYLPNFTTAGSIGQETVLRGNVGKRILCLANLRQQKNHLMLVNVAERIQTTYPDWTFHFVGSDFEDDYSKNIKAEVAAKNLDENVFIYDSRNDTGNIISQSDIAVLSSNSEGLPVALLEYGLFKKAVVVTDVGEMPLIIKYGENGFITPSEDEEAFFNSIIKLIESPELRTNLGNALYETILKNNSKKAVINSYLDWIRKL